MTTDTSEKGLESLIMRHMTGSDDLAVTPNMVAAPPPLYEVTLSQAREGIYQEVFVAVEYLLKLLP